MGDSKRITERLKAGAAGGPPSRPENTCNDKVRVNEFLVGLEDMNLYGKAQLSTVAGLTIPVAALEIWSEDGAELYTMSFAVANPGTESMSVYSLCPFEGSEASGSIIFHGDVMHPDNSLCSFFFEKQFNI